MLTGFMINFFWGIKCKKCCNYFSKQWNSHKLGVIIHLL
jgi:hypothetical protein